MPLKLVFMGTPDFSVAPLEALLAAGHEIVAVYSQPPRPAGRGMAEQKSPVQRAAEVRGLVVRTPRSLKGADEIAALRALGADAAVVVAYGLILPKSALDAFPLGAFNIHASKLPRWRGAAPIQRAIMAGDTETAVMIMRMEEGLDTGPVAATTIVPISPSTTAGALHDALSNAGARLIVDAMAALEAGTLSLVPQPAEGVTYAAKIDKGAARIDFTRAADAVRAHIHGLSPFPGAWFEVVGRDGKAERLKVLSVATVLLSGEPGTFLDNHGTIACGAGAVRLLDVQRAGKKPMPFGELAKGFPLGVGTLVNASA
ncbi:MAG: methionyl-tRNA formyltransferase [Hyphomicrobium sp.]|nr:methionyl-tRNA formyltransferase [Hyphomicrobium sp.]